MGRILVIHPEPGFRDLVKRILHGVHQVEAVDRARAADPHLSGNGHFDAVLCGIGDIAAALQVFEEAYALSPSTSLIPIADHATEAENFWEKWRSLPGHETPPRPVPAAWLPNRCTAGEILALFATPAGGQARATGPETTDAPGPDIRGGELVDGYRLEFKIGEGGFGTIWMAANEITGKNVAVKFVHGEEQIRQELAALRKYVHVADRSEYLIPVEHINCSASHLWCVTPLADSVTGGTTADSYRPLSLATQLESRGHLGEPEAVSIALGLVRGLWALHQANLLHGDVSPFNVLSVRHRWVLADPGLVRFQGEHGVCRNRRYYPQPEVVRACDDLYALGLTFWDMVSGIWEMSTGKDRLRVDDRLLSHISAKKIPLTQFLWRALAENPEQRYASTEEMLHDLEALQPKTGKSAPGTALYEVLRPLRTG